MTSVQPPAEQTSALDSPVKEAFWHLCVADSFNADTYCIFRVYEDDGKLDAPCLSIDELYDSAERLASAANGAIYVECSWCIGENVGNIEFWYFKPMMFNATSTFISRVIENLIHFYIAKQLFQQRYPNEPILFDHP